MIQAPMNNQSLILIFAMTLLLVIQSPVSLAGNDSARLQQVNEDIKELRILLKQIVQERSDVERKLENSEKALNQVRKSIQSTEEELRKARDIERKQQAERQSLQKKQVLNKQNAARAIKAAYMSGQDARLKLLLNQQDMAQANRMVAYYDRFSKVQADALLALQENERQLTTAQQNLLRTTASINTKRDTLTQQEEQLSTRASERKQLLAQLTSREKQSGTRLSRLEKEQQELQDLLASITSIDDITTLDKPFTKRRGSMQWPVQGRVVHRYGEKRSGSKVPWNGIFITAGAGTTVKAPHHGRVVFSDWMKSFGQLLIIDHGGGLYDALCAQPAAS